MSRFRNRLAKRVMAVILSGAMVMSGVPLSSMTAYASEAPTDTGGGYISKAEDVDKEDNGDIETTENNDAADDKATDVSSKEETILKDEDNASSDEKDNNDDAEDIVKENVATDKADGDDEANVVGNSKVSEMETSLSTEVEEEEPEEKDEKSEDVKENELQTMTKGTTYTLDMSNVDVITSGSVKENDVVLWGDNHFALLCGNSTQVEDNKSNTFFKLDYATGQVSKVTTTKRLAIGGNGTTSKQSIKFVTEESVDVTVYWASKAAGRQMTILDKDGKVVAKSEVAAISNGMYTSTMTLKEGGAYYLEGNNYLCKVEVEPAKTKKELKGIYDFKNDKTNFPQMTGTVTAIEGGSSEYYGLIIDANKNAIDGGTGSGKWNMQSNRVQINTNTIVYIPVEGRSKITITATDNIIKYTLDGKDSTGAEDEFISNGDGGYATMKVSSGRYLNSIKVVKIKQVSVSGTVDVGSDVPEGLNVIFTDKDDSTSVIEAPVGSNGSYSAALYEGSTYAISLSEASFDISEPASKEVTIGSTAINNLNIKTSSLDVQEISGSIIFPDNKQPADLAIEFKSQDGNHTPPVKIEGDTYKVSLEKNSTYNITATGTGIKDYDCTPELSVKSDDKTIKFTEKTKHNVSIEVKSFKDGLDVSASDIIFTDTEDSNYVYSSKIGENNVSLRDGTYSVAISQTVEYPYQLTCPELEVKGDKEYKYILDFKERLVWDFTIADPALKGGQVKEGYTNPDDPSGDQFYNGLYIKTGKFDVRSDNRVQVNEATQVKIPVSGRGTVAIEPANGSYTLKRLTNKDQDASTLSDQNKNGTITYNEDTKYILMEATGLVWLTKIAVTRDAAVSVSGHILNPDNFDISDCSVSFVNQTDDTTIPIEVESDGSYTIKLTSGHTYIATLSGNAQYGFADTNKTVKVENTDKTGIDLTVVSKDTVKYSGKIVGFADDYERMDKLKIILTAGVDKVELNIDEEMNFTADLESNVEYTIQLEGVDDYSLKSEATIKKTANYNANIEVEAKLTYAVSGKFLELDEAEVTKLSFTRLNDEGGLDKNYIYEADLNETRDGYSVKLRDGEYEASAEVAGYKTQTHVVVNGKAVERDLLFIWTDTSALTWKADLYVGYEDKEDNYNTVTKALMAAKRMSPSASNRITIHIAPGTYREQITVDVPYITFKNDSPDEKVVLTWYYGIGYQYYSIKPSLGNDGFYDPEYAYNKTQKHTAFRWGCTVRVRATDFRAENITFENSFNRYLTQEEIEDGVEPTATSGKPVRNNSLDVKSKNAGERAAALYIEDQGDRAEFYNCQFLSNQDTLGTGSTTPRSYFKNCLIEGNTDYICGAGDAVFDNCELKFAGYSDASSGGYITAASTPREYGYLFWNCTVTATTNEGANKDNGYLGRPWFDPEKTDKKATVTFVNTVLDRADIIIPVGWNEMSGTKPEDAIYKEYNTTVKGGSAADTSKRTTGTVVSENPVTDMTVYFGNWTPSYYNHVAAPTSETTPGTVTKGTEVVLKCATEGAVIRYTTNGDAPTANSTTYEEGKPIVLNTEGEVVIKAIAFKGDAQSAMAEFAYTVVDPDKFVAIPTADAESGKVEKGAKVALNCATDGAKIYYTIDGNDPKEKGMIYETPIEINETTTIRAIAEKNGNWSDSVSFEYTIETVIEPGTVAPPTANPQSGSTVKIGDKIELSAVEGASICYRINGDPLDKNDFYEAPIIVDETMIKDGKITVNAYAELDGKKSNVVPFTYTIKDSNASEKDPDDPGEDKSDIQITGIKKDGYDYTGAKIIPDIKVWDCDIKTNGKRLLEPGVDYTVAYKNNVNVGENMATVIVTGKGNYVGKDVTETFSIKEVKDVTTDLKGLKGAKIAKIDDETYDGTAHYPEFTLTFKDRTSATYEYDKELKHYTIKGNKEKTMDINVAVSNNINKGTATIYVSGEKDANGKATSAKATFKITPIDLSTAQGVAIEATNGTYAVSGAVPASLKVKIGDKTLIKGIDYTVKYAKNKKAGQEGTITIIGKGNYTKKKTQGYKIDQLDLSKLEVSAVTACDGMKVGKVKATVLDQNGMALKASQYTVKIYTEAAGTSTTEYDAATQLKANDMIYVAVEAKDTTNLKEKTSKAPFRVGIDISKAKIALKKVNGKAATKEYKGSVIILTPEEMEASIKVKGEASPRILTMSDGKSTIDGEGITGDYMIVSYTNNINKGTATAVIKGINDYSGTKTIKFKITPQKMVKGKTTDASVNLAPNLINKFITKFAN